MKGSQVLCQANPRGCFLEGFVSGTPYPGTVMQISAATEPIGGRYTWEVYNAAADGNQRLIAVLLEDQLQGKLYSTAYATGDRCFLYCPLPGEEINMLVSASGTATSDSQAIGDLYIVDDGTGLLVATTGTPESEPFMCLETVSDVVAGGTMTHCMFTGY
jgi:hypothetical protein